MIGYSKYFALRGRTAEWTKSNFKKIVFKSKDFEKLFKTSIFNFNMTANHMGKH